jgi:hypothetical protein
VESLVRIAPGVRGLRDAEAVCLQEAGVTASAEAP